MRILEMIDKIEGEKECDRDDEREERRQVSVIRGRAGGAR